MPDGSFTHITCDTRACAICGDPPAGARTLPYGQEPWRLVQCFNCGFAYVPEVPRTVELVHNLSWDKQHGKEAARRRRDYPIQQYLDSATRWRLALFPRTQPADLLNRLGPAEGDVVDIGCGSGDNLAAIDRRFTVHGIEISAELAARARQGLGANGGRIIQASALEGLQTFSDFSLAGAVLRSFLEHDSQAGEVMHQLGRKLGTDGVAVLKVPNYGSLNRRLMGKSWCGFRFPDHVNYFRKRDITRMAISAGLSARFPLRLSLPTDDNFVAILTRALH